MMSSTSWGWSMSLARRRIAFACLQASEGCYVLSVEYGAPESCCICCQVFNEFCIFEELHTKMFLIPHIIFIVVELHAN
ncbi:hypothetical protein DUNSADRAFT_17735 [Dunaliella salina]|uniref:Secreted protein n=1 Tax=Dunaliella salina TaxID=3046 RepID=A0ABQ7G183_DUNSA|nr:hypothetical protein DUNSADRAFT_17735 [Dunaliella salina]|eukprot:KAF5828365.1 hypothetical protein DUNSADRAFT_17735 [Dunaliella salina]